MKRIIHMFLVVSYEAILKILFSLPRYYFLNYLKSVFLRMNGAKIGRRVCFYPGVWIAPSRNLIVGDDVDLALDVLITAGGGVEIGDRTLIGYRTQILSTNHNIPDNNGHIFGSGHEGKKVIICADVWIGCNVTVLPGVTIGTGAVVAAGSIVTRNVEPYSIIAGNPAKFLKMRS